ncbi:MAG: hypothetical protein E4H36_00370, partial [Spirochaetales bacterium]
MNTITVHIFSEPSKDMFFSVASGTSAAELLRMHPDYKELQSDPKQNGECLIAAMVNNKVVSLSYRVDINADIKPVFSGSLEGSIVYRQTLCFLLAIAAKRVFPDRRLVISHSLGEGYYYYFAALQNIKDEDLKALE